MPSCPSRPADRIGVTFNDGFWNMNDGKGPAAVTAGPFSISRSRMLRDVGSDGYAS